MKKEGKNADELNEEIRAGFRHQLMKYSVLSTSVCTE